MCQHCSATQAKGKRAGKIGGFALNLHYCSEPRWQWQNGQKQHVAAPWILPTVGAGAVNQHRNLELTL